MGLQPKYIEENNVSVEDLFIQNIKFFGIKKAISISKYLECLITQVEVKNQEQIVEVEFDFKIEKQFIRAIPHLKSANNIHDTLWELTFDTSKDMRSKVFDFAHDNGLKILSLTTKNKNLEILFRELTT